MIHEGVFPQFRGILHFQGTAAANENRQDHWYLSFFMDDRVFDSYSYVQRVGQRPKNIEHWF